MWLWVKQVKTLNHEPCVPRYQTFTIDTVSEGTNWYELYWEDPNVIHRSLYVFGKWFLIWFPLTFDIVGQLPFQVPICTALEAVQCFSNLIDSVVLACAQPSQEEKGNTIRKCRTFNKTTFLSFYTSFCSFLCRVSTAIQKRKQLLHIISVIILKYNKIRCTSTKCNRSSR